jgi:hypothetical protein
MLFRFFGWKHGFFNCCGSIPDCLFAFMCPCTYACVVSDGDGQGTGLSILQCIIYPCLVPVLRYKARNSRHINGINNLKFWFKNIS